MKKHFTDLLPHRNTKCSVTKEQQEYIDHEIALIDFKRLIVLLTILLIVQILFIFFVDILNLPNSKSNFVWADKRYFALHLLLSCFSIFGIIFIKVQFANDNGTQKTIYKFFTPVWVMIFLIIASIINGLDQSKIGQSSSVFIADILLCGSVIILKLPVRLTIYSISYISFIYELISNQKDPELLYSNIINGTIFVIAVLIISRTVYISHFIQLYDKIILKETNDRLDYLSSHDQLTGLFNRRYFELNVKRKINDINAAHNSVLPYLLLIDIDHFKNVNDTFGHPAGDIVIKTVSNILLKNIKDCDLAARWGGEEFLLFLNLNTVQEAKIVSNTLNAAVEKTNIVIDDLIINVTISIGAVRIADDDPNSFSTSYKLADQALYQAKSEGRNQVVIVDI